MVFVSLFGESVGIECGVWGAVFFFCLICVVVYHPYRHGVDGFKPASPCKNLTASSVLCVRPIPQSLSRLEPSSCGAFKSNP